MYKISIGSVWEYLDIAKLPLHLRIRLKEPEKRSKSEKELLEKVTSSAPNSTEKASIGEKGPEKLFLKRELPLVPERGMSVLAREKYYQKRSKEDPEWAHRIATEVAEKGRDHVEAVIRTEKEREKEKKPVVRVPAVEFKGPPAPLRVQLGRPIMEALEKYVKDKDIISPEIAVKIIVGDFLTREGYCGKIQTSHLKTKREVSV